MQSFSPIHWQGAENEVVQASRVYEILGMFDEKCVFFRLGWCVLCVLNLYEKFNLLIVLIQIPCLI